MVNSTFVRLIAQSVAVLGCSVAAVLLLFRSHAVQTWAVGLRYLWNPIRPYVASKAYIWHLRFVGVLALVVAIVLAIALVQELRR